MQKRSEVPKKAATANVGKDVIAVRFSALGDIAMSLPPLYDACAANPERRFIFVTRPHPSELFINAPSNFEIFIPDLSRYKGMYGLWRLTRELRRRYPEADTFVDIHDVIRTKIMRVFLRMRGLSVSKYNKNRAARKALTRRQGKTLAPLPAVEQCYRDAFEKAGIPCPPKFRTLYDSNTHPLPDLPAAILPKQDGERWIAVAPFARHAGKIYPPSHMKAVIRDLSDLPQTRIFIFGFGDEESAVIERWTEKIPEGRTVNMARLRLGMAEELPLLARCDVMLSMDSGNMHLAGLVGLRTVTIWGATHPFSGFNGRSADLNDAVQMQMICRPCSVYGNKPCHRGDYHCLGGITPRRVVEHVTAALERNQ